MQVAADRLEDAFQHLRVKEERGAEIEAEAIGFEGAAAAADARQPLHDVYLHSGVGEEQCRGESAGAGADDYDFAAAPPLGRFRANQPAWHYRCHAHRARLH
jgi:hypothetical protein